MNKLLKDAYKNNKKAFILSVILIIGLLLFIIGTTYAFLISQNAVRKELQTRVTTGTMDRLSFQIDKNIEVKAGLYNFKANEGDKYDVATATIMLSPNSETGSATNKYNLFLVIDENEFEYTTIEETPEVVIKVTDPNNHVMESISGLNGSEGYFDITTKTGAISIAANYPIQTSNGVTVTQEWRVELRLINLNSDQNSNQGKTLDATLYLTKDNINEYKLPEVNMLNITTTNDSITASLNTTGTAEVNDYYFGIDTREETMGYIVTDNNVKVERLANRGKQKPNLDIIRRGYKKTRKAKKDLAFVEKHEKIHTFTGLTTNQEYDLYVYTIDENGFRSNLYSTTVVTTNKEPAKIISVGKTITPDSIELKVNAEKGTSDIKKYAYSIDNGASWIETQNSTYKFDNLKDTRGYNIKIVVIDNDGLISPEYYEKMETEVYYPSKVNNVEATSTSTAGVLTITAIEGSGTIQNYQYKLSTDKEYKNNGTNNIINLTGLTKDTEYTYNIRVKDSYNKYSNVFDVTFKTLNQYKGEVKYLCPDGTYSDDSSCAKAISTTRTVSRTCNNIASDYYTCPDGTTQSSKTCTASSVSRKITRTRKCETTCATSQYACNGQCYRKKITTTYRQCIGNSGCTTSSSTRANTKVICYMNLVSANSKYASTIKESYGTAGSCKSGYSRGSWTGTCTPTGTSGRSCTSDATCTKNQTASCTATGTYHQGTGTYGNASYGNYTLTCPSGYSKSGSDSESGSTGSTGSCTSNWSGTQTMSATCTASGIKKYYCSKEGVYQNTEICEY